MELHLPAELRAICDLNTLKLESSLFVEDGLRQYFSDVLYSLKTTAGDGYIHVLVEHQSTPDKHMAYAMRWPPCRATRWLDEFDDPALAGKLYNSAYLLVDVTVIPDDEIAERSQYGRPDITAETYSPALSVQEGTPVKI